MGCVTVGTVFAVSAQTTLPGYGDGGPASSSKVPAQALALARKFAAMRGRVDTRRHALILANGVVIPLAAGVDRLPGMAPNAGRALTERAYRLAGGGPDASPPAAWAYVRFQPGAYAVRPPASVQVDVQRIGRPTLTWADYTVTVVMPDGRATVAARGVLHWASDDRSGQVVTVQIPRMRPMPREVDVSLSQLSGAALEGPATARIAVDRPRADQ